MPIKSNLTKEDIAQMIRVNHAGEYGARRIYAGQMAVLRKHACFLELQHMYDQELSHMQYFAQEIVRQRIRPTALQPAWHVLGYALGAATALLGEKAAMACTVAVEDAIAEHYQEQIDSLRDGQHEELKHKIEQFRNEELEHRHIGIERKAEETAFYRPLYKVVQGASKLAIWLSKRI
jgi:ubiquinone biosynthesis monooxygenase Coq7